MATEKKRILKVEREQKKGKYQQRIHCFRQGHPLKRTKESINTFPSADQKFPMLSG